MELGNREKKREENKYKARCVDSPGPELQSRVFEQSVASMGESHGLDGLPCFFLPTRTVQDWQSLLIMTE